MKRTTVFMLACLCVVPVMTGCSKPVAKPKPAGSRVSGPVTVKQAEEAVSEWIQTHEDEAHRSPSPELKDITTPEVRDRLHAQIFEVRDWNTEAVQAGQPASYIVKDGQAYPMGYTRYGPESLQTLVTDIDGDSKDDLIFTFEWCGSGLTWSHVAAYRFNERKPTMVPGAFQVCLARIMLKTRREHAVDAYIRFWISKDEPARQLGELTIVRKGGQEFVDIKLAPDLPKKCKDAVYRIPPPTEKAN